LFKAKLRHQHHCFRGLSVNIGTKWYDKSLFMLL